MKQRIQAVVVAMVKFDVFVGNIEFSVTDELLVTIFSEVGRVLDIRMKQEAGRPAGHNCLVIDRSTLLSLYTSCEFKGY